MTINLHLPNRAETLKPKITVIGVGGAGGNAVNNMIAANLEGVDFVMANTDAQALQSAMTDRTVQLGITVTRGLGAGANPQVGSDAAEEAIEEIADHIHGSHMVFITAGMGGGTGTGAAPVIARLAREQGILTVGVVTKPFHFEGTHRMRIAEQGIEELQEYVDTLIVIPNQNLFRIANEKTTFAEAFRMADEVLHSGVRGVTDLMVKPGLVNLDFADIRAVMSEMGKAMMGTGEAKGDKRAIEASEAAISNPLLDEVSLKGARAVLINITGGPDMTLYEVDEAANRIRNEVDPDANIIFGSTFSDLMEGKMRVSVVATGIDLAATHGMPQPQKASVFQRPAEPPRQAAAPARTPASYLPEPKRERTAQEIVREAGSTSAIDLIRAANERQKRGTSVVETEKPAMQAPRPMVSRAPEEPQGLLSIDEPEEQLRKPFKLGEVREQVDNKFFISPKAEQPLERPRFVSQPEEVAHEEDMGDFLVSEQTASASFKLFQKIAGVGKALSSRQDETPASNPREQMAQTAAPRTAVKESPAPLFAEEYEEALDIPAFLRRQAN